MARKRSGFVKKMDNTRWVGIQLGTTSLGAGSVGQTYLSAGQIPETWLRMRGNLIASLTGTQAPGVLIEVAAGLIVVPEGTGATVTSSPLLDENAPWLWYSVFVLGYQETVTDVIDIPGMTSFREVIDNKAMRRIRPDREVQLVIENVTIGNAGTAIVQLSTRVLLGS